VEEFKDELERMDRIARMEFLRAKVAASMRG